MKPPLTVTVVVIVSVTFFGWRDHRRLTAARERHAKLVTQASTQGIVPDPSDPTGIIVTKRPRVDTQTMVRHAAAEFIAFGKELELVQEDGGPADAAFQQRTMDFKDYICSLDPKQLKALLIEIQGAGDLKAVTRQGLIGFAVRALAYKNPKTAMMVLLESSDLIVSADWMENLVATAFCRWAAQDSGTALVWYRDHMGRLPTLASEAAKCGLVSGTARQDAKLAFQLMDELQIEDRKAAIGNMMAFSGESPGKKAAILAAFRDYVADRPDAGARNKAATEGAHILIQSALQDGFELTSKWLAGAEFSAQELGFLTAELCYVVGPDTGKWIEWLDQHLQSDTAVTRISEMVTNWTSRDHQAAADWLATAPDSPARQTAIRVYVETVSGVDPQAAVKWALTLPTGQTQKATLRHVYQNWPKDDPASKAAAETFAREHGLKE